MGKHIWLVPSDADRKKVNELKNWATTDLKIEDGIIQTYPHITVVSFREEATVEDIEEMINKRKHSASSSADAELKLELKLGANADSEDDFWRTAYQPISSITISGKKSDKKDKILDFFANTLNSKVVEGADAISQKWTARYMDRALDEFKEDASKRKKYPHVALAYTVKGGKDRSKREAIAASLAPKMKQLFPDGKITVDRIWVVDCEHSDPGVADSKGVRCIPTWDKAVTNKKEYKLKDVPGFVQALL